MTLNAFSMPSHLPPVTGQVTDLQRQVGFPKAAWSGNNRNAELPYSWRALLSSLLQGVPIPSQLTPLLSRLTVGRQWIRSVVGAKRDWGHIIVQLREMTSA